eukprot:TRINITY_DN1546_c0_g2_i1.p2 TRINITY_DN1546_c0_g2~~TRINITY_DN1546_c0_g2_i1.p2  ORF type:complete len:103 (+),score=33.25 TRINITY_DN1546_c0_g2_i1:288-596(+)
MQELKHTTYLNMSQIDLYNSNWAKARERATKSLEIKETAKGYFRRACANIELNNLDEAKSDLQKVASFDPNNAEIPSKIAIINAKLKEEEKKLQKRLQNMFA